MGNFLIGVKIFILSKINNYRRIDEKWFRKINNSYLKCGFLDDIMLFLTYMGEFSVPALIMYIYVLSENKYWVIHSMHSLATVVIIVTLLKIFIGRKSPAETLDHVNLLGYNSNRSMSFPSMSAALSFAAAILVILYFNDYYELMPVALAITISRVYSGICYPSDILIGSLIGVIIPIVLLFIPH